MSAVTVNLGAGSASGAGVTDTITLFENVIGSSLSDLIIGDSGANSVSAGEGADTVEVGEGADTIDAGAGDDLVLGGSGSDSLIGGTGTNTLSYSDANNGISVDLSSGTANGGVFGNDTFTGFVNVIGSIAGDSIVGDSGANSVSAGEGADTVTGGLGANVLDGGDGIDVLTYQSMTSAVTVNLGAGSASGAGVTDTITLFENVIGSSLSDLIIGDSGANSVSEIGRASCRERVCLYV